MRKQGSRLKARIKLLTTISILSSILATIALILCGLLVYFIMNSSNIDQLDSNNDLQSNSTHPKIEENTSQLSLQQQDENNNLK